MRKTKKTPKKPPKKSIKELKDFDRGEHKVEEIMNLNDDVFENIENINKKTSELLIQNGYNTIDSLIKTNVTDLSKIDGVTKR